jgi:hypothetical protein
VRHLLRRAACAARRRGVTGAPEFHRRVPAERLSQEGVRGGASCPPVRGREGRAGFEVLTTIAGRRGETGGRRAGGDVGGSIRGQERGLAEKTEAAFSGRRHLGRSDLLAIMAHRHDAAGPAVRGTPRERARGRVRAQLPDWPPSLRWPGCVSEKERGGERRGCTAERQI